MRPRIAIPVPHSDPNYVERSLPLYEKAIEQAGGEPVRIPLEPATATALERIASCDAVVLPGSKADVEPANYGLPRHPKTAQADVRRHNLDALLLQDAYDRRKPILGICYGLQSLNVYRRGTLVQHIESRVNHEAGRKVARAHTVELEPQSKLTGIITSGVQSPGDSPGGKLVIPVNSSHHQSADRIGDGLRIVARCPDDGIIEALEGISPDHFVLAVQWHPERSVEEDGGSRALFGALVSAAQARQAALAKSGSKA
jgi:putative glutamine amidotransferase